MERLKIFLTVFLLCLGVVSCTDSDDDVTSDYELATRLMDSGDYSSAIHIMEGRLRSQPQDQRARLLLAAGYAGRAGVLINDFFDLASEITRSSRRLSEYFDEGQLLDFSELQKRATQTSQKNALELLERTYRALFQLNSLLRAFELLPSLPDENALKDLNRAIYVLEQDPDLQNSPALYRGLLRIVLFKYDLKHNYNLRFIEDCKIKVLELNAQFRQMRRDILEIFDDIIRGTKNQKSKAQLRTQSENTEGVFAEVLAEISRMPSGPEVSVRGLTKKLGGQCP